MALPPNYSNSRLLYPLDDLVISCGTVPIDVINSKVLILHYRVTGEIFLPKGRKDIDESLEQPVVRETHILKIIFWYVARANSCSTPNEGTRESGEEFDAL